MRLACNILVYLLLFLLVGCGGGDGCIVGPINGPDNVDELSQVQYNISASGDTGITYQWAVTPQSAGHFIDPESDTITFCASEVNEITPAEIYVVVLSDHNGPIIKTKDIAIIDAPDLNPPNLEVNEISGPDELQEYGWDTYSISASGDEGINYQWSCVPVEMGIFGASTEESTLISAAGVDMDTQIEINVVVTSDNCGPVIRNMPTTILDMYNPSEFLGEGHPIEVLITVEITDRHTSFQKT